LDEKLQDSLDMIFLRDGVVEAIELSAPPCTTDPCPTYGPILLSIELLNSGAGELLNSVLKWAIVLKSNFSSKIKEFYNYEISEKKQHNIDRKCNDNKAKLCYYIVFSDRRWTRRGKSCDISLTKNQLEMLHSSLTTWLEYMIRNSQ
jgi:hypothetical protein